MDDVKIMSLEDLQAIKERMCQFDDHALIRLVAVEQSDYKPQAVNIARSELHRRCLDVLSAEQYYEQFPLERLLPSGFCVGCHLKTTDESPGNASPFNFVGMRLIGFSDRCAVCGSVLQRMWYCLIVPVFPLDQYRVLYQERGSFRTGYVGRKLRKQET